MSVLDLCVYMDCDGCVRAIRKTLEKIKGVDEVIVDKASQRVTVIGYVKQSKIFKAIKKAGMRAVIWPYQDSSEYSGHMRPHPSHFMNHDFHPTTVATRYNTNFRYAPSHHHTDPYHFASNGYPAYVYDDYSDPYGYYYVEKRVDHAFSDANPTSCSIM